MNNMIIVSSNRIFTNKPKDENVNYISETHLSLCKSDNAIITDPKSGEIICSKCGMVILDKSLENALAARRHGRQSKNRSCMS